jgi:hypothetical protein
MKRTDPHLQVKQALFDIYRRSGISESKQRASPSRPLTSEADARWPTVLALAEMFKTTDNDYVFACLYGADLTPDELNRWLVAYSWFLHAGVAAYLAEHDGEAFYDAVWAEFKSFPRETERRHFRGQNGRNAVAQHQQDWPNPGDAVTYWFEGRTWESFCERARSVKMLGPMMRFQVYDTAQSCLPYLRLEPVTPATLSMCSSPTKGAELLANPGEDIEATTRRLMRDLSHLKAGPSFQRSLGAQEMETLFCRYKKFNEGRYSVGDDKRMVKRHLEWRDSRIARELLRVGYNDNVDADFTSVTK